MNRRDSLKPIETAISTGAFLEACKTDDKSNHCCLQPLMKATPDGKL